MPPTTLIPAFRQSVQQLVEDRENIRVAQRQLVGMFVKFCVDYDKAYQEARRLGNAEVAHLNGALGEGASTVSRWRKVAQVARQRRFSKQVTRSLPASQEIIVELSRRELAKPGTIQRLVQTKKVTPDTTVKEVRGLLKSRQTAPRVSDPPAEAVHGSVAVSAGRTSRIVLCCEDAAELLRAVESLLRHDAYKHVSALVSGDTPLYEQGKAKLGGWWKANGSRFTFQD